MVCKKCEKVIDDCPRHCPHTEPVEEKADVPITITHEKFLVVRDGEEVINEISSYDRQLLSIASLIYDRVATMDNVVEINDRVSGLRIKRDRKIDCKTVFGKLDSARRLIEINRRR